MQVIQHGGFYVSGRNCPYRASIVTQLGSGAAHVVAVDLAVLPCVAVGHRLAAVAAANQLMQKCVRLMCLLPSLPAQTRCQYLVHIIPELLVDDGFVLPTVHFTIVLDESQERLVIERPVYVLGCPELTCMVRAFLRRPGLGSNAL